MAERRTKRRIKKRTKSKRSSKVSKPVGLIYYKMNRCKYCKMFEKELLTQLIDYCRKRDLRFYIVVRELNPELIPNKIKYFPSLVKYDKNDKMTIFKGERTFDNLKRFLN